MTTPNPPAFDDAIAEYLAPYRDQFNYQAMRHTFTDNERFHRWAAYVDRLHPVAGSAFLSSGCGMGGSLLAYHDAGAATVTGTETDSRHVRFSRLRVAEVPGAAVHQVAPRPPLPFDDDSFDLIESLDVIEHVEDPLAYLADLVRVLTPGGRILLVTPNRLWPVEQHLGIAGPPWLPMGVADALFTGLSKLPFLDSDRRFRYAELAGMRAQNMSLRRLYRLAARVDLQLEVLRRRGDPDFPLPAEHPLAERLLDHPTGQLIAPVRTLAVMLQPVGAV